MSDTPKVDAFLRAELEAVEKLLNFWRSAFHESRYVTHTLHPAGWVVAVEEDGAMRVYGQTYSTREAAEQDAALPIARGQKAEVWECRRV
jgi:hypothetical protein